MGERRGQGHRGGKSEGRRGQDHHLGQSSARAWRRRAGACFWWTSIPRATPPAAWAARTRSGRDGLRRAHRRVRRRRRQFCPRALARCDLMPTAIELAGAEIELVDVEEREKLLKKALAAAAGAVRLHLHRLPAVAEPADAQRADGGRHGADAHSVRVLRAGGRGPADEHGQAGAQAA